MSINTTSFEPDEKFLIFGQYEDWYEKFYAIVPFTDHLIVAGCLTIMMPVGIIGNLFSIYIFLSAKSLRTPSNLLLMNLSVIDFIMIVSNSPMMFISSLKEEWVFGKQGCDIYGALTSFGGIGSIIALTIISYDRYIMICFATEAARIAKISRSIKLMIFGWAYTSVFAILPLAGVGGFILDGFRTSCTFDYASHSANRRSFLIFMYLMVFVVPVSLNIYCYFNIFDTVKNAGVSTSGPKETSKDKRTKCTKQLQSYLDAERVSNSKSRFNMRHAVPFRLGTICFYGVGWADFGPEILPPRVSTYPALFAKSACIYNPIIYALSHPRFKHEMRKAIPCMSKPSQSFTTQGGSTVRTKGN